MTDSWQICRQFLRRHWRPLTFGLAALLILTGVFWLDSALSNSQFSEVFVVETPVPNEVQRDLGAQELTDLPPPEQLEQVREQLDQELKRVEEPVDPLESRRAEIQTLLDEWISSWANKDIGTYLSFYSANFDTPFGISREEWAGSRIRRMESPRWIRVQLEQVDFVQLEEYFAALSVTQLYATPGYADRTRKHIDLVKEEQGWKILREDAVDTVRINQ